MTAKQLLLEVVLAAFGALSAYAVWTYGVVGVVDRMFADAVTTTLTADLTIALSLVIVWMWQDARDRGVAVAPYVLLTLGLGSVGPLLYLIRREASARPHAAHAFGGVRP